MFSKYFNVKFNTDIVKFTDMFMKKVLVKILKPNMCKSYMMVVQVQAHDFGFTKNVAKAPRTEMKSIRFFTLKHSQSG